jgi:hypothetical protein
MFDPMDVFSRQFTPVEGGYLYYPSPKSGGKLITDDEFAKLASDWKKTFGWRGVLKSMGMSVVVIALFLCLSLYLPDWVGQFAPLCIVGVLLAWNFRAVSSVRRLVKDRPVVAPPKPVSQARREARAMIKWPFLIVVILACGGFLVSGLSSVDRSWTWIGGSGILLAIYLWTAFRKLMDSRE